MWFLLAGAVLLIAYLVAVGLGAPPLARHALYTLGAAGTVVGDRGGAAAQSAVSDQVLIEIAERLRAVVRSTDLVARYGGEEFAVLLPHTTPAEARPVAERLRAEIAGQGIAVTGAEFIDVTVSAGMAALPDHADSPEALVSLADHLLYDSKHTGRNRVTTPPLTRL